MVALGLAVGLGAVAWRANRQAEAARSLGRAEAKAFAAAVELQLKQTVSAAETLSAIAKQGVSGNFQRVATELLVTHPGLASLELEPGGIVSDIVPRAGHERMLGVNVLKEAGQRAAANEALAKRVLTIAGPVTLENRALGIVAREPVFQQSPDGRESFWGFVAASMELQEVLNQTRLDDLVRHGYNVAFFAPASGQQKAVGIALHGLKSLRDSVQEPVRVQNLNFRIALKPRGGWINKGEVALECLAVILLSACVALSVKLLGSRGALEAELRATTQRVSREAADRAQAQTEYRGAKENLETTQADLQQNQRALEKLESELTGVQAELKGEILARDEVIRSKEAELQETYASLRKAQATIEQLQAELKTAGEAGEAAAAERKGLERNQSRIAELQLRLEAAIRAGRQTAEASAASAARQAQLEESNRELMARLAVAERAQARVAELEALIEKAQEELSQRQATSTGSAAASPTHAAEVVADATAANNFRAEPSADESKTNNPAAAQPAIKVASAKTHEDKQEVTTGEPHGTAAADASTMTAPSSRKRDSASRPAPQPEAPVAVVVPAGPPATRGAQKASPRKKARRDDQLNLFGNEGPPVPAAKPPPSEQADVKASSSATDSDLPAESPKEPASEPSRHLPAPPPVDPAQLRKAVNQIVPLLAERDPGAKDCLRDNRRTFRSAFSPEAYVEFEQLVKEGAADIALEQLKKAVRKHGISA